MPPQRSPSVESPSMPVRNGSSSKGKARDPAAGGPLQRGSACLNCRKRKLKCNAAKPACQQCTRAGNASECSYDNGKALSKTQILQKRIAQLEVKLQNLQEKNDSASPASSPGSTSLRIGTPGTSQHADDPHNLTPYSDPLANNLNGSMNDGYFGAGNSSFGSAAGSPALLGSGSAHSLMSFNSGNGLTDTWPSTSFDSGLMGQSEGNLSQHLDSSLSVAPASDWSIRDDRYSRNDPNFITSHPEGRRYLLNIFLPRRRQCYFDVHVGRFLDSIDAPNPKDRPHPCLMDAIYLLGCYLSKDESLKQAEPVLLSRARQGLCDSLEHSDRLWNFVQASCLIAFYLYQNGRFIEAYHQTCQVARFAVSCGLHQISSPFWPESDRDRGRAQAPWTVTNMSVRRAGSMLNPARDAVEVGERILAFWHIFLLDRCGSVMTNLPAALPDECDSFSQIETVWPRTLEEYEAGLISEADYGTVRFLYAQQSESIPQGIGARPDTIFTLRLKASALFERASRLGARYNRLMNESVWGLFRSVDFAIARFSKTLPYVRNTGSMGEIPPNTANGMHIPVNAQLVFVHTLTLAATMRLHYVAAMEDPISYAKRLDAAESTVMIASELVGSEVDYGEFDMLLGHCWKCACDVFALERARLTTDVDIAALDAKVDILIAQMRALEVVFPLTVFQIAEVLQSRQIAL